MSDTRPQQTRGVHPLMMFAAQLRANSGWAFEEYGLDLQDTMNSCLDLFAQMHGVSAFKKTKQMPIQRSPTGDDDKSFKKLAERFDSIKSNVPGILRITENRPQPPSEPSSGKKKRRGVRGGRNKRQGDGPDPTKRRSPCLVYIDPETMYLTDHPLSEGGTARIYYRKGVREPYKYLHKFGPQPFHIGESGTGALYVMNDDFELEPAVDEHNRAYWYQIRDKA